ncbi:PxKF domain-containing protein [Streptomyces sp. NPDC029216]|uniref:PxKF domain-containing protein n=1 Tax=Streptomyces sp. NPDC029216 TaxID=3154701 RepID=UPI003406E7C4
MAFAPARPSVTSLSSDHGPTTGTTPVTLTGSHLTSTTAVTFDGAQASGVTVVDDSTVTATAPPAGAAGTVDVTVTTPAGTSAAAHYRYLYAFDGFRAPVDNPPAANRINAGRSVPLTFTLHGEHGLDVLAPGRPSVQQTDCTTNAAIGTPVSAQSAGDSALQYESAQRCRGS